MLVAVVRVSMDQPSKPARPPFPAVIGRRRALTIGAFGLAACLSTPVVPAQDDAATDEPAETDDTEPDDETEPDAVGETVTVELVDFDFVPGTDRPLEIPPGTLVQFTWETDNHNIVVDAQPEGAGWDGHEPIENTGFEHEFTFDVEGDYEFHCTPHIGQGMIGTVTVAEGVVLDDDEGILPDVVPAPAITLVIAAVVSLLAVLALAYMFLKYGGPSG